MQYVNIIFHKKTKKNKKNYDEIQNDYLHQNSEDNFKISVFYGTLDILTGTLENRFEDFLNICQKFNCLLDMDVNDDNLKCLMDCYGLFFS